MTREGKWRRLYPIRFRQLENKFGRWQWVEYEWKVPRDDKRNESRNGNSDSVTPLSKMRPSERARFLSPHIRESTDDAASRNESLALIRPRSAYFSWRSKHLDEIEGERRAYVDAARQRSLLEPDKELKALEPCPYRFSFKYESEDGKSHDGQCHDWETSAAYSKLSRKYGSDGALKHLNEMYNEHYPKAGMAFAMGTHSQRPNQWLLIGVLRLDEEDQQSFAL